MRDRRNTMLSMASTDSSTLSVGRSSNDGASEKRVEDFPDSPTLPLPATTKENCSRPRTAKARVVKMLVGIVGIVLFWTCACGMRMGATSLVAPTKPHTQTRKQADTEWIAANALPDEPTALVVTDTMGASQWTISIPHHYGFPLANHFYRDMCAQGDTMRTGLSADAGHAAGKHWWHRGGYFAEDPTYLDVERAESRGALPRSQGDMSHVCESSMTVVLDEEEAGFGKALLLLWMSYGLAKQEGRSFFIDDSKWAWGNFSSYFQTPPAPHCVRPPPHHIVPCPQSAKHVVVSSATAAWTFGPAFEQEFQGIHRHGAASSRRIFELARVGYEALFVLIGEDASYLAARVATLKADAVAHHGSVVGMQIRRGDMHPSEYEYSRDYLPVERYAAAARALLQSCHGSASDLNDLEYIGSPLLLASDDPGVIGSTELQQATAPFTVQRAQQRIQLATKDTLDQSSPKKPIRAPGSAYVKHVDENTGWDGGFFSGLFFSLGRGNAGGSDVLDEQALQLRRFVGRAYLLDLAVLGASDGVVCAVSSATCRAAAVMMGWDAVKSEKWRNVDDGRLWTWNGSR